MVEILTVWRPIGQRCVCRQPRFWTGTRPVWDGPLHSAGPGCNRYRRSLKQDAPLRAQERCVLEASTVRGAPLYSSGAPYSALTSVQGKDFKRLQALA